MRIRIGEALLIGALVLAPGFAMAEESGASIEQLLVDMAHTPADHAALAKYYRGKAADARAAAATHQSMSKSYGGGKMTQRAQMEGHCKNISQQNTATAAEYEALAKLHEEESKKPQ